MVYHVVFLKIKTMLYYEVQTPFLKRQSNNRVKKHCLIIVTDTMVLITLKIVRNFFSRLTSIPSTWLPKYLFFSFAERKWMNHCSNPVSLLQRHQPYSYFNVNSIPFNTSKDEFSVWWIYNRVLNMNNIQPFDFYAVCCIHG